VRKRPIDQVADLAIANADATTYTAGRVDELEDRLDAHAARLRTNQVEGIAQAGLPADLVQAEASVWKWFTPGHARWPEVQRFDERLAEMEMTRAAVQDDIARLGEELRNAPSRDAERLAEWQLGGQKGPRPERRVPTLERQLEERRAEHDGVVRAAERVADEKVAYVAKHRKRLTKEAREAVEAKHSEYVHLVDLIENVRAELHELRRLEVWAHLYPSEVLGRSARDTFAGGRKRPLTAMGLTAEIQPGPVFAALRVDADFAADAASPEQRLAMEGRSGRTPPDTHWTNTPEGQAWVQGEVAKAQRAKEWGGDPPGGRAA
jgi:hypothetical protein